MGFGNLRGRERGRGRNEKAIWEAAQGGVRENRARIPSNETPRV
jgi:hypothetical protein